MAIWQDEETIKLLDLWSEENVQTLLERCTRNKTIYYKLAEDLAGYGITDTIEWVDNAVNALRS